MDQERDETGGEGEKGKGKGKKGSPPTSSGRTGPKGPARITAGKNRKAQIVQAPRRKLFKGKLRQDFLEWFAATANVAWSCRRVGIAYQTIWKHRMKDPLFLVDFERALEQGTARVRAKMFETKAEAKPAEIEGDWDAPELQDIDPQLGLSLLRAYGQDLAGPVPAGRPRKQGRRPRAASNEEVEAALVKRLAAYSKRLRARGGKPSEGDQSPPDQGQ